MHRLNALPHNVPHRQPTILTRAVTEGRELFAILRCREVTAAGKLSLLMGKARYHTGRLTRDVGVRCRVATIWFGRESFAVDWYVFHEIFLDRIYDRIAFDRASVLDLGAHKGYFGAFALSHGAREVVSFEPEAANFGRLSAATQQVPRWTARQEAIGGVGGFASLKICEAWSHRLVDEPQDDEFATVRVTALKDLLRFGNDSRRVVKIDIEGAECAALACTPTALLADVDELVVEAHAHAPCGTDHIVALAQAAGLMVFRVDLDHGAPVLHFLGTNRRTRLHGSDS